MRELHETILDLTTQGVVSSEIKAEIAARGSAEAEARAVAWFERQFDHLRSPETVARGAVGTVIVREKTTSILDLGGMLTPPAGTHVSIEEMNPWKNPEGTK